MIEQVNTEVEASPDVDDAQGQPDAASGAWIDQDTPSESADRDPDAAPAEDQAAAENDPAAEGAEDDADGDEESAAPKMSKREETLTNEGEIAADYLEELLDIADMDGDIDTYNEGGRAHVSVITDSDKLVGKDGEVLDALQELARLAVMTETGHRSRLMLDIANFREQQRASLEDMAADAIAEVRDTGEAVRLTPMNPYQRKIVHDAVAAAGLVSESEGEEPRRRVVVLPKG